MAEQLNICLTVTAKVYSHDRSKSTGLEGILPFGLQNLLIGFRNEKFFFSDKKSSFWERTKSETGVYNEKRLTTLRAGIVIGAAESFPQDTESPFS